MAQLRLHVLSYRHCTVPLAFSPVAFASCCFAKQLFVRPCRRCSLLCVLTSCGCCVLLQGGFNISLEPGFSASRLAWLAGYNGVFAQARACTSNTYNAWARCCSLRLLQKFCPGTIQPCGAGARVTFGLCALGLSQAARRLEAVLDTLAISTCMWPLSLLQTWWLPAPRCCWGFLGKPHLSKPNNPVAHCAGQPEGWWRVWCGLAQRGQQGQQAECLQRLSGVGVRLCTRQ